MKHDTESMDTMICPHCGADHGEDVYQMSQDINCIECGKPFHSEPEYATTYTTTCVEHTWPAGWKEACKPGWKIRTCEVCLAMETKEPVTT